MTDEELKELRSLTWMPSRIPVLDALTTSAPKGGLPKGDIPQSYEQRWYPQQDDTVRLLIPYNGQEFDPKIFHIEPNAWDHTTCDHCNTRIPAMTLCYVTKNGS